MVNEHPLKQLFKDFPKVDKKQFWLSSLYSVINKFFDVMPEILIGIAIDTVVNQEDSFLAKMGIDSLKNQVVALAIMTLVIWALESLFEYLFQLGWRGLAQKTQHRLRMKLFSHLQRLSLSFYEKQQSGNLASIVGEDINQMERFLEGGMNRLIQVFTAVILVGSVFFYLSPMIALLAFTPIPIIILGSFFFQKKAQTLYSDVREKAGILMAKVTGNLQAPLVIQSFTREQEEIAKVEKLSLAFRESNQKAIAVSSAFIPLIRMAILMGFLMTLVVGGFKALSGELNVGSYGILVFLTQRLLWPLTGLAETADLYERSMASIRRIFSLLHNQESIPEGSEVIAKPQGILKFTSATFTYPQSDQGVKDINLEIFPGKMVALVGMTGSGKSTLMKLMLRFYDLTSGEITLDGNNIIKLKLKSLRQIFGLVSQEIYLFAGTIRENLQFADPQASDEELIQALKLSHAWEFVEKMPEALDTLIGERGQQLSGGQKQRLSLARALLTKAQILILDEATSAVDNETESLMQQSIQSLSQEKGMLVMAHRLSTIIHADEILVMDRGRIIERGTHQELKEAGGQYQELWRVQTGI